MTQQPIHLTVEQAGERLDKLILKHLPELSRTQVQALIKASYVTLDGKRAKAGIKLKGGESITISLPETETPILQPESIDLNILYEDEQIAVIDKKAGMVVHPGVGNTRGTLVNALLARYPEINTMRDAPEAEGRMGIVHRLDKGTSGVMVVARQLRALNHLMRQFQERTVEKTYLAWLERTPKTPTGRIEAPIGRDPKQRKRMGVQRDGKPAITEYEVLDENFRDRQALVKLNLLTGRTHQIRVHMAFIGCPVVGDSVYGFRKQRTKLKRQFLHAVELRFDHPMSGERLHFESPLPPELQQLLMKFR